jgi:hypothetical protein
VHKLTDICRGYKKIPSSQHFGTKLRGSLCGIELKVAHRLPESDNHSPFLVTVIQYRFCPSLRKKGFNVTYTFICIYDLHIIYTTPHKGADTDKKSFMTNSEERMINRVNPLNWSLVMEVVENVLTSMINRFEEMVYVVILGFSYIGIHELCTRTCLRRWILGRFIPNEFFLFTRAFLENHVKSLLIQVNEKREEETLTEYYMLWQQYTQRITRLDKLYT